MKKVYFLLLGVIILFASCQKKSAPEVMTGDIYDITSTTAGVSGFILDNNNSDITEAGYCWGTMTEPMYDNCDGIVKDAFTTSGLLKDYTMTDLMSGTEYFVRAFAVNDEGIGYGLAKKFTPAKDVPIMEVAVVDAVTPTTITLSSKIVTNSGAEISRVGFKYSTLPGVGAGSDEVIAVYDEATQEFTAVIEGLTSNTQYYVRAFATNRMGMGFSAADTEVATITYLEEFSGNIVDANGVAILKYEVSVGLWNEITFNTKTATEGLYPKTGLNYDAMLRFINKLNEKGVGTFDLPTAAEWRTAAGSYTYSGGDVIDNVAWYIGNSNGIMHKIGLKAYNEYGVFDMTGNAWEMTKDLYDASNRIILGGSWNSDAEQCKTASSFYYPMASSGNDVGFRVVRK
ncbi:MAG: SUMF1/EgtB/PvdO family nonheme iron enzyme [Bacteroidales bacterium]|nr:SUMF1/EgtB/PvdO family nonheme iron enzyme [Bacteroidales bacterium]